MQKSEYSTEIITDSACLTSRAENVSDPVPLCIFVRAALDVSPCLGLCVRKKKGKRYVSKQE